MNRHSSHADKTATNRVQGPGLSMQRLAMCGHKSSGTGGKMRGRLVMLCAACVAKKATA
jgi:hypothetical protein